MSKIQADSPDQTTIVIDGTKVTQFWDESILLSLDNLGAGFSFTVPFFPGEKIYRDLFRPAKFHKVQIYIGSELVLTGTMERPFPSLDATSNTVNVQGRSKPGVLVDCTFEKGDTMEFLQTDLRAIANTVTAKYGITTSFPNGAGAIFEKAGPHSPTEKVFNFLQNLSRQRKLLISQTPEGALSFPRAKTTGKPVAELVEGQQGLLISTADYDGTKMFSSYDVFGQEPGKPDNFAKLLSSLSKKETPAATTVSTDITNPKIFAIRPKSIKANDTNQGNIADVAAWALTADIADAIRIPIGYEGWLRPDGKLWNVNQLITVHAPSLMIYKPFLFLIKSVIFNSTSDKKTTALELTLPAAYSGVPPEAFPWDE